MREKQSRRVKGKIDIWGISCIEEVISSNISVRKLGRSYPRILLQSGWTRCPKTIAQFWICSGWSHDRVMYLDFPGGPVFRAMPMLGTLVLSLYWKFHITIWISLCTPQLLRIYSRAEMQLLKPVQWAAHAPTTGESDAQQQKIQYSQNQIKNIF